MALPKSVGELTIRQFQQLLAIQNTENDPIVMGKSFIKALTGKNEENLEIVVNSYKELCYMLVKRPSEIKYEIQVNGTTYRGPNHSEKLKSSQYIDLKNLSSNEIENLHLLVAVIYQPTILGVVQKYDGSRLPEIGEAMLDAKVGDVYGLLFFYSNVLEKSNQTILTSFNEAQKTIQNHMTEMMSDSEFLRSVGIGGT